MKAKTLKLAMIAAAIGTGMAVDPRGIWRARNIAKSYAAELEMDAEERQEAEKRRKAALDAAAAKREAKRRKRAGVKA